MYDDSMATVRKSTGSRKATTSSQIRMDDSSAPSSSPTPAARVMRKLSDMFGSDFGPGEVPAFKPGPETPPIDPHYVFRKDHVRVGLLWLSGHIKRSLFLSGPTSSGKSSFIEQLCSRMGWECFRFPANKDVEMVDLTGGLDLTRDGTEFTEGLMVKAMEAPAGVLLIDEIDLMNPAINAGLHTLLDGRPLWIPQAKRFVSPSENFRIAATGNSSGLGDSSKVYRGVQKLNVATIRRYLHLKVDYLSREEEKALLLRTIPGLDDTAAELMTRVAELTRTAFVGGLSDTSATDSQLDVVIGTDTLITWAKLVVAYEASSALRQEGRDPILEALYPALLNCLMDPGNIHKAHAITGFLTRVRNDFIA